MNDHPARSVPAMIWCPFPNADSARQVSGLLLDEKLIGCANLIPALISIFQWDGKRDEAEETGALFKTNSALLDKAIERIAALHPYDQPAILGWVCDESSLGTANWLRKIGA